MKFIAFLIEIVIQMFIGFLLGLIAGKLLAVLIVAFPAVSTLIAIFGLFLTAYSAVAVAFILQNEVSFIANCIVNSVAAVFRFIGNLANKSKEVFYKGVSKDVNEMQPVLQLVF